MTTRRRSEINENFLVLQSDTVRYEQAYRLNKLEFLCTIELAEIIGTVLGEILKRTDKIENTIGSVFDTKFPSRVSMPTYLTKLVENFKCSQEALILAMIYIDRLTVARPKFIIQSKNIHKLMLTAIVLASKFLDDRKHKNEYYAKHGDVSLKEINKLEVDFLETLEYNLYVNPVLFYRYREQLVSQGRPLLESSQDTM